MQLIHGDCLEKMKDIPDKSIDMILCDLPYGTTACKWDVVIPFEPLWEQYKRIIKDRGPIVLFGSEPFSSYLRMSNIKQFKYDWVWDKTIPSGMNFCKKRPMSQFEIISVFGEGATKYFPLMIKRTKPIKETSGTTLSEHQNMKSIQFQGGKVYTEKYPINILSFPKVPNSKGTLHPTQKPVALLEYLIKTYTIEGETVLDNCMGSGSTGVACINTNRDFIGIEKDDKYFEIAKKRIEEHLTTAST